MRVAVRWRRQLGHAPRQDRRLHQRRIVSWNLTGARIDPAGNTSTYTYNPHEHITSITDPLGNQSRYDLDSKDRLIRVHRNGRVREEYSYDVGDRQVEKRGHDGEPLLKLTPTFELASGGRIELDYDARACTTKASTDLYDVRQSSGAQRRLLRARCGDREIRAYL